MVWPKGRPRHQSEHTRRKISEAHKGKKRNPHSDGHRKKISDAQKLRMASADNRRSISEALKGRKFTEEVRINMSNAHKGKKPSEESRQRMREAQKGPKNNHWKGGLSLNGKEYKKVQYHKRRTRESQAGGSFTVGEWETLKQQYGCTCPICGRREPNVKLEPDHIIPVAKGGNGFIVNIQPLCRACNNRKKTKVFRVKPNGDLILF